MITIMVMGGLGNQLFQIFNLVSYCLTNKVPFYFEKHDPDRKDRPFYWDTFFVSLRPFVKNIYPTNIPIYKEANFHYTEIVPFKQIDKPFKFFGYYQSHKYFQEKEYDIFKFINLHPQRESAKSKYHEYAYDNMISLHFRIGDYKDKPEHHPLVNINYYVCALKYILSTTKRDDWSILYFYEEPDIDIIKYNINILQKEFGTISFVPIDTKIVDYEQLLLMSLCQHNIIANSSFSWWGAYFNQCINKIVTYPNPDNWFGPAQGNKNMTDMFPNTWCKI